MTLALAHDPRLPRLLDALDEDTAMDLLGGHLPLVRCRPRYVRYKPGTSCLVQYNIALRLPDGRERETTAHLTMYADDRGHRRADSGRMRRLLERATKLAPEIGRRHAVFLPELGGLVQVLPVDHDLPALVRAADPCSMNIIISRSSRPDIGRVRLGPPRLVRYKPGRKALLLFDLAEGAYDRLYAKLLEDDRGAMLFAAGAALRDAGVATPRALMCSTRFRLIAHEPVAGTQLASLRGAGQLEGWMEEAAIGLARLQAVELPDLPARTVADEAATLDQTVRWLASVLPELTDRLTRVGTRIGGVLANVANDLRTVHGDFYDDQILVSDAGITILDLDELHRAHPLTDVGNMLAHLRSGADRGDGTGPAHERFLRAALAESRYTVGDVAPFEAAALLKLAPGPFRRLERDWPERIERIVSLAESCLTDGRATYAGSRLTART